MNLQVDAITPIHQISLAEAVLEQIRRAIIMGNFKPGQRLSENALSTLLEVSRSPIREALQRLEVEGLVVSQKNRSCTVWEPSEADVKEIFSLREVIETLAAEWCINDLTDEDFEHLGGLIENQRVAIETRDYISLIHLDKLFHEFICIRSGHRRLLGWWYQIIGQWEVLLYRRLAANPTVVIPTVLRDHHDLLEALRERDLVKLRNLHREINDQVRDTTVAALTN